MNSWKTGKEALTLVTVFCAVFVAARLIWLVPVYLVSPDAYYHYLTAIQGHPVGILVSLWFGFGAYRVTLVMNGKPYVKPTVADTARYYLKAAIIVPFMPALLVLRR